MDRKSKKILTLYRNHILSRLEFAYADGRIDQDQYRRLHDEVSATRSFGGLRLGLVHLRTTVARRDRSDRSQPGRVARWRIVRQQERARRQRRWWRPDRFWVLGVAVAVLIGLLALAGLIFATEWLSTVN